MNKSFSDTTLKRFREMPSADVLTTFAEFAKCDPTYVPTKDSTSRRWHVKTVAGEFELITTRTKWYDTRAKKGGGGAIDLVMHITGASFVDAVKLLTRKSPALGSAADGKSAT